jgi:hypothetical protein
MQVLIFVLQLSLIAWLRTALVIRTRYHSRYRWLIELGFGVLVVLPLLAG